MIEWVRMWYDVRMGCRSAATLGKRWTSERAVLSAARRRQTGLKLAPEMHMQGSPTPAHRAPLPVVPPATSRVLPGTQLRCLVFV